MESYQKKYAKYTTYSIPPHITIYPPFYLKNISEKQLFTKLDKIFVKTECDTVTFNSVDYFEGKNNVAFVKPDSKSQKYIASLLEKMVKSLAGNIVNVYGEYNITSAKFNPHMTIAEKIPDNHLPKIKSELSSFRNIFKFNVKAVFVFKQNTEVKRWKLLQEIINFF